MPPNLEFLCVPFHLAVPPASCRLFTASSRSGFKAVISRHTVYNRHYHHPPQRVISRYHDAATTVSHKTPRYHLLLPWRSIFIPKSKSEHSYRSMSSASTAAPEIPPELANSAQKATGVNDAAVIAPPSQQEQEQQQQSAAEASKDDNDAAAAAQLDAATLEKILTERLEASPVAVEDISGGCGSSFSATIVSAKFAGKNSLARARLVNGALKAELESIHAWTSKCMTPQEWEAKKG